MTVRKKNNCELDRISNKAREVFRDLLKEHIKDKKDIEALAKVLGKTTSLVKKMLYKADGGLDVWIKAFSHIYQLDEDALTSFRHELKSKKPSNHSDKVWFSIRDDYGASDEDMLYLAMCAKEAMRIKNEVVGFEKNKKK